MKDEISDLDIKKALVDQLERNDSITVTKLKRKKAKKESKEDSPKAKQSKTSKQKSNNASSISEEGHIAKKLPPSKASQRPLRPPPKVVVFEEPGRSKDKDNSRKSLISQHTNEDDSEDFLEIARDVREFGMTGFSRKEQRKYEQQKAQALGAKAPKGLKMPYKIYMDHIRARKRKEEKRQQLERAMGMSTKKSKNQTKEKVTSSNKPNGWWTDQSSKGLDMSIGKYKKGVQTLSSDDIKRIKSNKRQ